MENTEVLQFDNGKEMYKKLAYKKKEQGLLIQSLTYLLNAYRIDKKDKESVFEIAEIYSLMGLDDLSRKYLFILLDLTSDESDKADIYNKLSKTYFLENNILMAGYYADKTVSITHSTEDLDIETDFRDFLEEYSNDANAYYLAYPYELADYSYKKNIAKQAYQSGNFDLAIKCFNEIPFECYDEENIKELADCYYIKKEDEKAFNICRDYLKKHGDSLSVLSCISTISKESGEIDKSEYYFNKIKKKFTGSLDEIYKILPSVLASTDHEMVKFCLNKITAEREYDDYLFFLYGLALANSGEYCLALEKLGTAFSIDPNDCVYEFYYNYVKRLVDGENDAEQVFPCRYVKELPVKTIQKYKRKIHALADGKLSKNCFTRQDVKDALVWGVQSDSDITTRLAIYVLSSIDNAWSKNVLYEMRLDPSISNEIKSTLFYAEVSSGRKDKIGVVVQDVFYKIKPKKLLAEKYGDTYYTLIYAFALSKTVFSGFCTPESLVKPLNDIYLKLDDELSGNEDICTLSALAVILSDNEKGFKEICTAFNADLEKVKYYYNKIVENKAGDKND